MEPVQEGKEHYPGETPVSTDDLIFQIGELTVDLERKKKAIREIMTKLWHVSQEKIKLEEQISTDGGEFENIESEKQRIQEEADAKIEAARQKIIEDNSDWGKKIAELRDEHAKEMQNNQAYFESEKEKMVSQLESEKEKMKAGYEKTLDQLKKKLEKQRKEISKFKDA